MLLVGIVFFFSALLIFTYIHFEKDIIHPSIIYSFVYLISTLSALYNIDNWGIDFQLITFLILFGGSIEFVLIGLLVNQYYKKKHKIPDSKRLTVNINKYVYILICAIGILIVCLQIYYVIDTALKFGGYTSFVNALKVYKDHISYYHDYQLPHYYTLLCKILEMSAYISIYVFLQNILRDKISKKIIVKNLIYLFPPFLYILKELLSSSRITILSIACAIITIYFLLMDYKKKWEQHIHLKSICMMFVALVMGLMLFYTSAKVIGRVNTKGPIDYITCYAGGSIEDLNLYLQDSNESPLIAGGETFYQLYGGLERYGIINFDDDPMQYTHLEFKYHGDNLIGNVYTAYRRWYSDFGVLGIILLNGIMSLSFHLFYYSFKYGRFAKHDSFMMILYGYLSWTLFLHPIDSYFFISVFQISFITNIIVLIILWFLLTKFDFCEIKHYLVKNK